MAPERMYRDERTTLKARLRDVEGEHSRLEVRRGQLEQEIERREAIVARARRWIWLPRLFVVASIAIVGALVYLVHLPARRHVDQQEARRSELSRAQTEARARYDLAIEKAQALAAPLLKSPAEDAYKTRILGEIRFHDALDPRGAQLIVGATACAFGDEATARQAHQVLVAKTEPEEEEPPERGPMRVVEEARPNPVALLERLCADKVKLP